MEDSLRTVACRICVDALAALLSLLQTQWRIAGNIRDRFAVPDVF